MIDEVKRVFPDLKDQEIINLAGVCGSNNPETIIEFYRQWNNTIIYFIINYFKASSIQYII